MSLPPPRGYAGPDRRRIVRTTPTRRRAIGRARIRFEHARHRPGFLPEEWYPVVDRIAHAIRSIEARPPLRGYMYLEVNGRGRQERIAHFHVEMDAIVG
jgi:hypothetical protein